LLGPTLGQGIKAEGMHGEGASSPYGGQEVQSKKGTRTRYSLQWHILSDLFPTAVVHLLKFLSPPKIALRQARLRGSSGLLKQVRLNIVFQVKHYSLF
jgi:hypothetical protein